MISACNEAGLRPPRFEEIGTSFRVTLYSGRATERAIVPEWWKDLERYLAEHKQVSTHHAARIWNVSDRTARSRLRKLTSEGFLSEIGTSPKDPKKVYVLSVRSGV
jgi:predicted HTH transcriptional regulator